MASSSPVSQEPEASILGQLLALQGSLHVLPSPERIGQFVCQALGSTLPQCSSGVCLRGQTGPIGDFGGRHCAECPATEETTDELPAYDCHLAADEGVQVFSLATLDRFYGYLFVEMQNLQEAALYEPFLNNVANAVA